MENPVDTVLTADYKRGFQERIKNIQEVRTQKKDI